MPFRKTCFSLSVVTVLVTATVASALDVDNCAEMSASFGSAVRLGEFGVAGCSGVLISDRAVLTAAHCVKSNFWEGKVHVQERGSKITPCITHDSANRCTDARFEVRRHSDYTGDGDTEDDIAIVFLSDTRVPVLRYEDRAIPSSDFSRLYNDTWDRSKVLKRAGFGVCNNNGAGDDTYREANVVIDKWHDKHFRDRAKHGNRQCNGDSGGPAWLRKSDVSRPVVVGLAGASDKFSNNKCAMLTRWQRWVKVSPKTEWISDTLEDMSGRGCRPPHNNPDGFKYLICFD